MKLHLTLLIATFVASSAHIGGRPPISQDLSPHVYCGRRLARMLATVCDYDVKRSGPGSMKYPIFAPYYGTQEQYNWPHITSQKHTNQEFPYKLPHKMDSQTDWSSQKSESQYSWPPYGLLRHKTKDSEDWPSHKTKEALDWPWLVSNKAKGLELPSRNKKYVVSECCEKACTVDELLSYC